MNHPVLQIQTIESQPFGTNSYVVHLGGRTDCVVVDPSFEPGRIVHVIEQSGLTPAAILLTHGHIDHIAGNAVLKQRWPDCPLVIGRGDAGALSDPEGNLSGGMLRSGLVSPRADVLVKEGDVYQAAGLDFEVREIPGHSPGHVVYIWHGQPVLVLGGDVLFAGGIGRFDFPGGSFEQLATGIRDKLYTLPDDTQIWPGHGPPTTVGTEKRSNPYVAI